MKTFDLNLGSKCLTGRRDSSPPDCSTADSVWGKIKMLVLHED